ncbi:histone-lysine N-methyltransferase 2D-like, partial [Penaeus monodon]|uniref:histone-lysine N-methyltransferase 2D-like n=1 Tax=Penaeus monodon TaxID=6687 RepID=UPI0018A79CC3
EKPSLNPPRPFPFNWPNASRATAMDPPRDPPDRNKQMSHQQKSPPQGPETLILAQENWKITAPGPRAKAQFGLPLGPCFRIPEPWRSPEQTILNSQPQSPPPPQTGYRIVSPPRLEPNAPYLAGGPLDVWGPNPQLKPQGLKVFGWRMAMAFNPWRVLCHHCGPETSKIRVFKTHPNTNILPPPQKGPYTPALLVGAPTEACRMASPAELVNSSPLANPPKGVNDCSPRSADWNPKSSSDQWFLALEIAAMFHKFLVGPPHPPSEENLPTLTEV